MTDPSFEHQRIALLISAALLAWTRLGPGRGLAGFGGNWTLAPGQSYKPDAWWVAEERRPPPDAVRSGTPPDLVVEVRSPGAWWADIGPKRAVYERAGVAELWLVDTPARVVLVSRRSGPQAATFDDVRELGADEVLTTPLLDGFAPPLDELFGAPA